MKITKIEQQQKNKQRYSIYVDGKYSFSLSEWQIVSSGIHSGQELDKQALDIKIQDAEFGKAYDKVLNWFSIRPRSEGELENYLFRKIKDKELRQRITATAVENRLLNDESFARSWVESRRLLKNSSKRRLQQELRAKRVNPEIIEKVLSENEVDEIQIICDIVAKKKKLSRYADEQKLIAYLSRQGFSYSDIKQALAEGKM